MKQSQGEFEGLATYTIEVDGQERSYEVFEPSAYAGKLPAIFMFHGSQSSGEELSKYIEFNKIAEKEKYLVIYPNALVGNWAEACDCNIADRLEVKDIEFVYSIIDQIKSNYTVDLENIYAVGYSQGGLFTDRIACEMSNVFKGAIVVAANMSVPLSISCEPSELMPITFIQGMDDVVLNYYGSDNGNLSLLSAKETARFWALKNNIISTPITSYIPNDQDPSVEVLLYKADNNQIGKEVIGGLNITLFSLYGVGHTWPSTKEFNTNSEINDFILKYMTGHL